MYVYIYMYIYICMFIVLKRLPRPKLQQHHLPNKSAHTRTPESLNPKEPTSS